MAIGTKLTAEEVGEMLGVDRGRVYQLARSGRLRGDRTPYGWFFDPAIVRKFAKEPRKPGRPPKEQ